MNASKETVDVRAYVHLYALGIALLLTCIMRFFAVLAGSVPSADGRLLEDCVLFCTLLSLTLIGLGGIVHFLCSRVVR